jgi:hypothetical protein
VEDIDRAIAPAASSRWIVHIPVLPDSDLKLPYTAALTGCLQPCPSGAKLEVSHQTDWDLTIDLFLHNTPTTF